MKYFIGFLIPGIILLLFYYVVARHEKKHPDAGEDSPPTWGLLVSALICLFGAIWMANKLSGIAGYMVLFLTISALCFLLYWADRRFEKKHPDLKNLPPYKEMWLICGILAIIVSLLIVCI